MILLLVVIVVESGICLSVCLPVCLSVFLPACLPAYLPISLSACLSIYVQAHNDLMQITFQVTLTQEMKKI